MVADRGKDSPTLKHPARPITLRDLLTHTSGIAWAYSTVKCLKLRPDPNVATPAEILRRDSGVEDGRVISDLPARASRNAIAAPKVPADSGLDPIATRAAVRRPRRRPRRVCRQADGPRRFRTILYQPCRVARRASMVGTVESSRQRRDRA